MGLKSIFTPIILVIFMVSWQMHAYIPSAEVIAKRMSQQRKKLKAQNLHIKANITVFSTKDPSISYSTKEQLWFVDGKVKQVIDTPLGAYTEIKENGQKLIVKPDGSKIIKNSSADILAAFLADIKEPALEDLRNEHKQLYLQQQQSLLEQNNIAQSETSNTEQSIASNPNKQESSMAPKTEFKEKTIKELEEEQKNRGLENHANAIVKQLTKLNLDFQTSSLGRFEDKYAYVIGAHPWQQQKNQVWVDKQTSLPLRIIRFVKKDDEIVSKIEKRYVHWEKSKPKNYFPSVIEYLVDNKIVKRLIISEIYLDPNIEEFSLPEERPLQGTEILSKLLGEQDEIAN